MRSGPALRRVPGAAPTVPPLRHGLPGLPADDTEDGPGATLALLRLPVARLTRQEYAAEVQRARRAPNPNAHRVCRQPARYKREPLGEIGHDPLAQAVVLPWPPEACPKCSAPVLRDRGLEVSCFSCGWAQLVRR